MTTTDLESEEETLAALEANYDRFAKEFQPWIKDDRYDREQNLLHTVLARRAGAKLGQNVFIARSAVVITNRLEIGENSWIAGGSIIRGNIKIGSNSTINPFCHVAGNVDIGSGVRIAGLVSIYGFNHGFAKTTIEIYKQAHTSEGVVIKDGTWIGANSVVTDGCTIGAHCVVGAGSVVTKDFPDYQIIGGNPARIIKSRL